MKKILVAFAMCAFASAASAAIATGSHDLTVDYGTTLPACQYCHTPHVWVKANVNGGPLWNRNARVGDVWTEYTSDGFTSTVTLGTASLVCLSCHDGQAMGGVNNGTAPGPAAAASVAAYANVGRDLTDDHPVGVAYVANTWYDSLAGKDTVKLFNNQVECASCHDPHGTSDGIRSGEYFQRAADGVDLCAECHLK